ncbi:hypothetical protein OIU76_017693 [Salix suchowensis]|nr:hypothetical protein OIU76_017693 [Salix suchowensis]
MEVKEEHVLDRIQRYLAGGLRATVSLIRLSFHRICSSLSQKLEHSKGISNVGFTVASKVADDEQSQRYNQEILGLE